MTAKKSRVIISPERAIRVSGPNRLRRMHGSQRKWAYASTIVPQKQTHSPQIRPILADDIGATAMPQFTPAAPDQRKSP